MKKSLSYSFIGSACFKLYIITDGEKTVYFATRSSDEGLWVNGKQILSTSEFTMPASRSSKYRVLKNLFYEYKD